MAREIEVAVQKAWTLVDGGRADEAVAQFDRVLAMAPRDAGVRLEKGVALFKLGRLDAALGAFEDALGLDPGNLVALNNRGKMLHLLHRDAEALVVLEQALAQAETAKTHLALAEVLDALGRREEALAHADQALAKADKDPVAHHGRGVVLWHMGRLDDARRELERALILRPDHFEALRDRAHVLAAQGHGDLARETLTEALKQHPKDLGVMVDLGLLCLEVRPKDSLGLAERAITLDRDAVRAWRLKARAQEALGERASAALCEGVAAMVDGDLAQALVHLDAALAIDPRYAQAWSNKGVVLNRLERYEDALAAYDHALAIDPKAIPIWHNKGMILYHKLDRRPEAIRCFKETVRLDAKRWFELPSEIRLQVDQLR